MTEEEKAAAATAQAEAQKKETEKKAAAGAGKGNEQQETYLSDIEDDEIETPAAGAEAGKDKKVVTTPVALNLERFKEVDPDLDSEDKLFAKLKELHEETPKLKILAKGTRAIEEDKDIQGWRQWARKSDEDLFVGDLVGTFERAGYPQAEAIAKAQAKLTAAKEKDPESIETKALQIRGFVNAAIEKRGNEIIDDIQKAASTLKAEKETDSKFGDQVKEKLNGFDNFLGLKLAGTPEGKKKLTGKGEALLGKAELAKLLKDPDFVADAIFLHTNKKAIAKAIADRSANTRSSMMDKIHKAPAVRMPNRSSFSDGLGKKNFDGAKMK